MVSYLRHQIERSLGIHLCVLLMDLCAIQYMWESWCRGKECGELERRQVDFESREALPGWSKSSKQEPSAHIDLSFGNRGRFIESAARLIKELESQGQGSAKGFLFRPLNRQRDGFEDVPLSSAALRKRVQIHLKDAGLFEGETLHSFRRSAV
jgi:integrase